MDSQMKGFRTLTPQFSSYLYRGSQKNKKMILRDNPGSRRIRPEDNTALSTHGEICLRYDLLDSDFLFFSSSSSPTIIPSTDKFIEFLTNDLTASCVTASWHPDLKCDSEICLPVAVGRSLLKRAAKLSRDLIRIRCNYEQSHNRWWCAWL